MDTKNNVAVPLFLSVTLLFFILISACDTSPSPVIPKPLPTPTIPAPRTPIYLDSNLLQQKMPTRCT